MQELIRWHKIALCDDVALLAGVNMVFLILIGGYFLLSIVICIVGFRVAHTDFFQDSLYQMSSWILFLMVFVFALGYGHYAVIFSFYFLFWHIAFIGVISLFLYMLLPFIEKDKQYFKAMLLVQINYLTILAPFLYWGLIKF